MPLVPERVTPGRGRASGAGEVGALEEDLEGEIDRAAALEQAHREVQVDLVRGGEHGADSRS